MNTDRLQLRRFLGEQFCLPGLAAIGLERHQLDAAIRRVGDDLLDQLAHHRLKQRQVTYRRETLEARVRHNSIGIKITHAVAPAFTRSMTQEFQSCHEIWKTSTLTGSLFFPEADRRCCPRAAVLRRYPIGPSV